ncbi:SWIRM domain-containing protein FUN19 [Tolypocladium capitatum]|uniref:SWIRM domain-containing protein FUN19 n=1 Tax=Tolypocladium capitatum TaxID=45235 RepID=A0A2K3QR44_9HYPO|nr:SWIRM domain-containing protein FUN19 [Tolypocladium capitatum]
MADKPTSGHLQSSATVDRNHKAATARSPPFHFSSAFSYFHQRPSPMPMASSSRPNEQPQGSMPPPPVPAPAMEMKKLDIISLMSPPDAVLDSFNHGATAMNRTVGRVDGGNGRPVSAQPLPMSPPVSPYSKPIATANAPRPPPPSGQPIKDPVLYPHDEHSPQSPPQAPLFAPAELEHRRIVDEHVRARSESIFAGVSPPRREDYELALTFRSQVMKHYTSDRKAWLRKERALLEADRRAGAQRYHAIMPAKPIAAKPPKARVSKTQAAPRQIRNNPAATTAARPARPAGRVSATPEPSRRIVAPNREDKDFDALPNYCPPLDSLPNRSNSLKVDWKGQPIDLGNDPNAHLLHPDEVMLAGNLRLDCATYLTSKRRIFERRLQCLRTGKEFRKTDAQQACKIDVNKASKLWTAFDRVGWLDAGWVRRFL